MFQTVINKVTQFFGNNKNELEDLNVRFQLKALNESAREETKHTHDLPDLLSTQRQPLFVCDDHMRHRSLHNGFGEYAEFRGKAFTSVLFKGYLYQDKIPLFFFAQDKMNEIPPDWQDQTDAHPCVVRGEVFLVPSEVIYLLDKKYENEYNFIRKLVPIHIWRARVYVDFTKPGNRKVSPFSPIAGKAWMYCANQDYWNIDGGFNYKPMTIFRSNKRYKPRQYYFHSLRETQHK